jgi:hypothetical protein
MNDTCQQIIARAGPAWEFELAAELLETGLDAVRLYYQTGGQDGFNLPRIMDHRQTADYVSARLNLLGQWVVEVGSVVNQDAKRAFGPYGERGNAAEIEAFCGRIVLFCNRLVEWEREVANVSGPRQWDNVFALMRGLTRPLAETMFHFADEMASIPSRAENGETSFDLHFTFPAPPQLKELAVELPKAWKAGAPFWEKHPVLTAWAVMSLFK